MKKVIDEISSVQADNFYISAQGLKGRQSVRATFRLPEDAIQLLGIMARQLGLQQKSLFDQLIEDSEVLQQVASSVQTSATSSERKRQKTFVLSKRSLQILDAVAKRQDIPRDLLVEISIQRLLPVMSAEQAKHRKRLMLSKKMASLRKQCQKLAEETDNLLGQEDQATLLIRDVSVVLENNYRKLQAIIEKGQAVEEYGEGE